MTTWNDIPEHYRNALLVSDVLDYLRGFPDNSVPMFLFSPPYNLGTSSGGGMQQYGHYPVDAGIAGRGSSSRWKNASLVDGYDTHDDALPPAVYKAWQQTILSECWRALAPDGAIYYVHKPRIQGGVCVTPLEYNPGHLVLRQIIIWARAGGFNWNPTYYCPTHEWIVVFAKPLFRLRDRGASAVGDMWRIPQEAGTWHPAPFPLALAERAIETVMPAFVVDPFAGSGTTARAAKRYGIGYSGCDLSAAYLEKARAAIAAERTLTHRQTRIDDVLAEQAVLL